MPLRRKLLIVAVAIGFFFLLAITAVVAVFFSPLLTRYVESDTFRVAIQEETAKGLRFPQARYTPIPQGQLQNGQRTESDEVTGRSWY